MFLIPLIDKFIMMRISIIRIKYYLKHKNYKNYYYYYFAKYNFNSYFFALITIYSMIKVIVYLFHLVIILNNLNILFPPKFNLK